MQIPPSTRDIIARIDSYHEAKAEKPRPHLGCSQLGHPCDRWLWLSFRWAVRQRFPGRILRLFRRGQMEEAVIVSDLRAIGLDVRHTGSNQMRVSLAPHIAGSIDAIIMSGVPEAPRKRHIAEFKTHNLKSFNALERDGLEAAKPEHWVQVHLYMHGSKIDRALYVAVCKDDDRLYTERVRYSRDVALKALERGKRIVAADRIPEPLSTDPSWYQCRMCPGHAFCHVSHLTDCVNCRTCAHSTPCGDGTWRCERFAADDIPVEFQTAGCDSHVLHPDLVPWALKDGPDEWTAVYVIDGRETANGEPREGVYTSRELLANAPVCAQKPEAVETIRKLFGARVVG